MYYIYTHAHAHAHAHTHTDCIIINRTQGCPVLYLDACMMLVRMDVLGIA